MKLKRITIRLYHFLLIYRNYHGVSAIRMNGIYFYIKVLAHCSGVVPLEAMGET